MLTFIKNNKLLSIMFLITIITLITGIICGSILDNDTRKIISKNITNIILNIKDKGIPSFNNYFKCYSNNSLYLLIIWLFGISIIGLPLVIFMYILKVFIFSMEIMYLFINIKQISIVFIIIYLIPSIINVLILFLLSYYSVSYSLVLFRFLFLKRDYSLHRITKKYIKIFIISLIVLLLSTLLEIVVIPKVLYYII